MNKSKKLELTVIFSDLLTIIISYILATNLYLVLYKDNRIFFESSFRLTFVYFVVALIVTEFFTVSSNRLFLERTNVQEMFNIGKNMFVIAVIFSFLAFITRDALEISRGVFVTTLGIFIVLCFATRLFLKRFYKKINKNESSKLLVVTTINKLQSEESFEQIYNGLTAEIVGFVVIDEACIGTVYRGIPVVGDLTNLVSYSQVQAIDSVLLLLDIDWWEAAEHEIETLQSMGIVVHMGIDVLSKYAHYNRAINHIGNYPVISYAAVLPNEESMVIKRLIDICGGLIGSIFTILVMLILAPIIKIESKGPILFKQQRVGRNGRYFTFYKFRSMGIDAENRKADLMAQNEVDGHMFKMTNDPRVTRVGKIIRATSIDELPQFFNILKGDMSLVGTRPPTVDEYKKYEAHHKRRLSMKPGLTGMWQVSGRSNIKDFEAVVRLDCSYIDNFSLLLDIKIILKTFVVVFAKIGSH